MDLSASDVWFSKQQELEKSVALARRGSRSPDFSGNEHLLIGLRDDPAEGGGGGGPCLSLTSWLGSRSKGDREWEKR